MPSFAHIVLVGNLGRDMEVMSMPDGTPIGHFSVAVTTGRRDKQTTSWYKVSIWGKAATTLQPWMRKGAAVLIIGEPSIREWTAADGRKGWSVDVRAHDVQLLDRREQPSGGRAGSDDQEPAKGEPNSDVIPF